MKVIEIAESTSPASFGFTRTSAAILLLSWSDDEAKKNFQGTNAKSLLGDTRKYSNISLNKSDDIEDGLPPAAFTSYPPLSMDEERAVGAIFDECGEDEKKFYQQIRSLCPLMAVSRVTALQPIRLREMNESAGFVHFFQRAPGGPFVSNSVIPVTNSAGFHLGGQFQDSDPNECVKGFENALHGYNYGGILYMRGVEVPFGPDEYAGKMKFEIVPDHPATTIEGLQAVADEMYAVQDYRGLLQLCYNQWYRAARDVPNASASSLTAINNAYNLAKKGMSFETLTGALEMCPKPIISKFYKYGI